MLRGEIDDCENQAVTRNQTQDTWLEPLVLELQPPDKCQPSQCSTQVVLNASVNHFNRPFCLIASVQSLKVVCVHAQLNVMNKLYPVTLMSHMGTFMLDVKL